MGNKMMNLIFAIFFIGACGGTNASDEQSATLASTDPDYNIKVFCRGQKQEKNKPIKAYVYVEFVKLTNEYQTPSVDLYLGQDETNLSFSGRFDLAGENLNFKTADGVRSVKVNADGQTGLYFDKYGRQIQLKCTEDYGAGYNN